MMFIKIVRIHGGTFNRDTQPVSYHTETTEL